MRAKDVMSTRVTSVSPETPVREIAALLRRERISAVPVIEHGRLVGLVSEADLLRRHELGTERSHGAGARLLRFIAADPSPDDYVKSHATRARHVMTRGVVSVAEETPLAEIVRLLESRRIRRVPVVRDGRVVGIVSRADIVRALAATLPQERAESCDDEAIRSRLLAELGRQRWWRAPVSDVSVSQGVVHLWGLTETRAERLAAHVAAENVPGVRGIEDHRIVFAEAPWSL
ncbi:MAG: CBS domain-containing protein [Burkholderiales bacterium]|nr:CBS domain-containing protein [Burkholderiales bacterium]